MRDHAKAGIAEMLKLCPELLQLSLQQEPVADAKKEEEAADSRYGLSSRGSKNVFQSECEIYRKG